MKKEWGWGDCQAFRSRVKKTPGQQRKKNERGEPKKRMKRRQRERQRKKASDE